MKTELGQRESLCDCVVELCCEGRVMNTELGQKESLCDCMVELCCEGSVNNTAGTEKVFECAAELGCKLRQSSL